LKDLDSFVGQPLMQDPHYYISNVFYHLICLFSNGTIVSGFTLVGFGIIQCFTSHTFINCSDAYSAPLSAAKPKSALWIVFVS
jgi:hypothetical protein